MPRALFPTATPKSSRRRPGQNCAKCSALFVAAQAKQVVHVDLPVVGFLTDFDHKYGHDFLTGNHPKSDWCTFLPTFLMSTRGSLSKTSWSHDVQCFSKGCLAMTLVWDVFSKVISCHGFSWPRDDRMFACCSWTSASSRNPWLNRTRVSRGSNRVPFLRIPRFGWF